MGAVSEKGEVELSKLPPGPKATRKGGTFLLCAAWPLQGGGEGGSATQSDPGGVSCTWRLADTGQSLRLHSHVQGQHEESGSDRV